MKLLIKFIVLLAFTLHGAQAGIGGPCGSGLGERLMCHCRRARNCGYLEYKKDWRINHVPYSSWRSDHPRGSLGGNRYDEDDESVGLGFAGSTFRHAVNNQRPEVQRANRRGFFNGMKATFKNPGDIPTSPSSAAQKGLELGV